MKQTIRLTESDLHKIVKESVNRVLNEISLDTIDSANSQAIEKYNNYKRKYGENDPRTQKVKKQQQMFSGKFSDEYAKGNLSKGARMLSNQEKRMKGERTYVNGKGWRNDVNEGSLKEEVDLGQIDAMRDRPRAIELPIEAKREIRRLRYLIDDYEREGKDTTELTNAIGKIKDKYYPSM